MSAANRPSSGQYTESNVTGQPQSWEKMAPVGLRPVVEDLMLGKPKGYRIYFTGGVGDNGVLSHAVSFAANNRFIIAPGDLAALLDAGLDTIRVVDGDIVLYFSLPETSAGLKQKLRASGY